MTKYPVILAAEDQEDEALLLKLALKQAGLLNRLIIARDGQEVIDYLNGMPPYNDRAIHPLPHLMLLDLNMPRLTGLDVLEWLRTQPDFQLLPVIVLSSSCIQSEIERALALGAREYQVKPHNLQTFTTLLQELSIRWVGTNS